MRQQASCRIDTMLANMLGIVLDRDAAPRREQQSRLPRDVIERQCQVVFGGDMQALLQQHNRRHTGLLHSGPHGDDGGAEIGVIDANQPSLAATARQKLCLYHRIHGGKRGRRSVGRQDRPSRHRYSVRCQ